MKRLALALMVTLALTGCVTTYNVSEKRYDTIGNAFTTYEQIFHRDWLVEMFVRKWVRDSGETWYTVQIQYSGGSWLFIPGNVLIELDDSTVIQTADASPSRIVRGAGGVMETISAPIEADQLKAMAESTTLRIQYFADPAVISPTGIDLLSRFVDEHVRQ